MQKSEIKLNNFAKPFLKWAGGKRQLLPVIERNIPQEVMNAFSFTYIEPFAGSGAVLFHLLKIFVGRIKKAVINDINDDLANVYHSIKNHPKQLLEQLRTLQNRYHHFQNESDRKKYFLEQRDRYNATSGNSIARSALLIFLNKTCFNGLYRVNSKGQFNVPFGRNKNPKIFNPELIMSASSALQPVVILNGDYQETLLHATHPTLFYLDPPYKPISSSANFNSYTHTVFSDAEQIRLKNFCDEITGLGHYFILSNSDVRNHKPDNSFFDDLYSEYEVRRVKASRAINSVSSKRGEISELIISNENIVAQGS